MAKDDYFVIVYRILKYLYNCLKSGETPDKELLSPEYFGIGLDYWAYIIRNLYNDRYVEGVTITKMYGIPDHPQMHDHFRITPKGIEYIEENKIFNKVKELMKDISGLMPTIK